MTTQEAAIKRWLSLFIATAQPDGFSAPGLTGSPPTFTFSLSSPNNANDEFTPGGQVLLRLELDAGSAGALEALGAEFVVTADTANGLGGQPRWTFDSVDDWTGAEPDANFLPPASAVNRFAFFWTGGVSFAQSGSVVSLDIRVNAIGEPQKARITAFYWGRRSTIQRFASQTLTLETTQPCTPPTPIPTP